MASFITDDNGKTKRHQFTLRLNKAECLAIARAIREFLCEHGANDRTGQALAGVYNQMHKYFADCD